MIPGSIYYLAESRNIVFKVKEDKDTSLIRIYSYLTKIGAREVKEPLQIFKYIEIIQNLLSSEMDRELVFYDTLDVLYNAFVLMAQEDRWIKGILALMDNEKFNYKCKKLLSQLTPKNVTFTYLNKLKWENNLKSFEFMAFSNGNGRTIHLRLSDIIDDAIGSGIYDYIISNFSLKIYYQLNENYWYQHTPLDLKQDSLTVITSTNIVFNHNGQDSLIFVNSSLSLNTDEELITGVSFHLFSQDIEYFINQALKTKPLIIEATTDTPIIIPTHKITNRIFPLDTFHIKANCIFKPKDILEHTRLGILCFGKPGTGKTSYVYSVHHYILKDEGYILLNLGYKEYLNLPTNANRSLKVVILVNDADSIETEENRAKVLDRLETPIFEKTITFLTVNDTSKLDAALTRKGRIDYHLYFEKLKSSQEG